MKKSLLYFTITMGCLLLHYNNADAQVKNKTSAPQIEIMPFKRWDSYPAFDYAINAVNTNSVKINGASWGITASYKYPIKNNLYLKGGIGYYQYSFDKIKKQNRYGESKTRSINYPSPLYILFYTNKYSYNTLIQKFVVHPFSIN